MKQWLLLIGVIILVKGLMFVSYPFGGQDDDQSYQRYMVGELLDGNPYIGNLRYNTGYAFFIAPVEAVSSFSDSLSDRIVLLFQLAVSSLVPIALYAILKNYFSSFHALFVAIFTLIFPFGLQWAHFQLPVWLISVYLIATLWLIHRAIQSDRIIWIVLAGLVSGVATVTRLNIAPIVATIGIGLILFTTWNIKKRIFAFSLIGIFSLSVLGAYIAFIHYPSTGTLSPSCISGTNLLIGAGEKGIPLRTDNGSASQHYAELLTLEADFPATFFSDSYPLWRIAGTWLTESEQRAFLAQTPGETSETIRIGFPGELIYALGPCETDTLLQDVYAEAITRHPGAFLMGYIQTVFDILIEKPVGRALQYLPSPAEITIQQDYGFGFVRATGGFYTGQIIWLPGVQVYSMLMSTLSVVRWLAPIALIWAFIQKNWFYRLTALMLTAGILSLAMIAIIQPRIYASMWALYAILIAGFLAWLFEKLYTAFQSRR